METVSTTTAASVAGHQAQIRISVDKDDANDDEPSTQATAVERRSKRNPCCVGRSASNAADRPVPLWDPLRAQSLSRLETFVSSSTAGDCDRDSGDVGGIEPSSRLTATTASGLEGPTGTPTVCPSCRRRRGGPSAAAAMPPFKCPSYPYLTSAASSTSADGRQGAMQLGGTAANVIGSSIAVGYQTCCCCCCCCSDYCICGCCGGSLDVDASSMSPRLSSNVDLSQVDETDSVMTVPTNLMMSSTGQLSSSGLTVNRLIGGSTSTLGRRVPTYRPQTSRRRAGLPEEDSLAAATYDVDATPAVAVTLVSEYSPSADNVICGIKNGHVLPPMIALRLPPLINRITFPATMRRATSCPSIILRSPSSSLSTSGGDLQDGGQLPVAPPHVDVGPDAESRQRRRSHNVINMTTVDISLDGEVVEDLPVAVKPGMDFPDFEPDLELLPTASAHLKKLAVTTETTAVMRRTVAANWSPSALAAVQLQTSAAVGAPAQWNCLRLRRQTVATSSEVRLKCLQWLSGLSGNDGGLGPDAEL